jgi:hypothetical protein
VRVGKVLKLSGCECVKTDFRLIQRHHHMGFHAYWFVSVPYQSF